MSCGCTISIETAQVGVGNIPTIDEGKIKVVFCPLHKGAPAFLTALKGLTQLSTTPDGGIIIGPLGWQLAQATIANAKEEN